MLAMHRPMSRVRIASGTAALATLLAGGLALTASGTAAAEGVRTGVEGATGVDFATLALPTVAQVTAPPAPPAVPATPVAPARPSAPSTPAAPVAPTAPGKEGAATFTAVLDGEQDESWRRRPVVIERQADGSVRIKGEVSRLSTQEMEAFRRRMPQVRSENCGTSTPGSAMTVERMEGERRVTIICRDRMAEVGRRASREALASVEASAAALRSNHVRLHGPLQATLREPFSPLGGLRSARMGIVNNADLTPAQRDKALTGIDQVIAEIQAAQAN